MQSLAQEQPLALTAVKSHYPTNGKEEEVNTGEEALTLYSASADHEIGMADVVWIQMHTRNLSVAEEGDVSHYILCLLFTF